uniref:THAP-type domain-containing protein n=1 Tax=Callorhinchus milii TaxID=7868 RepID=A0A4W3J5T6_CALMI
MKREKWFPKRYQCICSDHFTTDSFEWRWGIRYLKPDAVPTVFLLPTHLQVRIKLVLEVNYLWKVLQLEHSYCRQDVGKAQLWEKISKLQRKIEELEQQEQRTVARLKSMEHLIEQLKQENLISEEKLKVMENCLTTFELTVLQ